jgi:hypothetical protein
MRNYEAVNGVKVTPRGLDVYRVISGMWRERFCAPTYREIRGRMGITFQAIFDHMERLRGSGVLVSELSEGGVSKGRTLKPVGVRVKHVTSGSFIFWED